MSPEQRRDSSTWVGILEAMEAELEHSSARSLRESMSGAGDASVAASSSAATSGALEAPGSSRVVLPANPGPIPAELLERARIILEAQQQAIERVETAKRSTGRHLAAMRSVPPHRGDHAVYLDISG